ncbi:alcohol dehydrogenase catalytic domain-containing protein [Ruminococcus sp. OA3]|uniref:zinc-dependent alcohol dehydrogenase n=1 Tax=Ruminococcus sp. OA3 TaxID=2914164 RepID=UPI001F05D281|nr:alcohol dehydrogenase catalytic domain-containing protein [Ruminococcus sp. OA3]MCH1981460.1 alcohol dehydrogenase catalytic domain-containing protein [Ruminococcus sp. OA3]
MKAAVLTDWNHLEIKEVPDLSLGDQEVLIRVAYTGICGSDIHSFVGRHPLAHKGMILGHEFSGTVEKTGPRCEEIPAGAKVCAHIIQPCGHCDACKKGNFNLCRSLKVLGTQVEGTFAEYVKVRKERVLLLPETADLKACAMAEPLAVGVYAAGRFDVKISDRVLVLGAGPIGLCCALAAQKAGACQVVLSEVAEKRIQFAKDMGFEVIDSRKKNLEEEAERITEGAGFDYLFETSGVPVSTELLTKVGAVRGSAVMVAYAKEPRPIDTWNLMRKEIQISSIRVHTQPAYEAAVRMILSDEKLSGQLLHMITGEFAFAEIQKAFTECVNGQEHCKIIVKM